MSRTHTADGRRLSSMTHAKRQHTCDLCGQTGYGNGFAAQHGRAHVRRGEAVEFVRQEEYHPYPVSRAFVAVDDAERIAWFLGRGFHREEQP